MIANDRDQVLGGVSGGSEKELALRPQVIFLIFLILKPGTQYANLRVGP